MKRTPVPSIPTIRRGFTLIFASLLIAGCGGEPSTPDDTTPQAEPNTFRISADPVDFAPSNDTTLDVYLVRGEGFNASVEFQFEPSNGLSVDPKTYSPAEDEDMASTTLTAAKAGHYSVEVTAKPASGDEKKITVDVTVE